MKKITLPLMLTIPVIIIALSVNSCNPINKDKYFEEGVSMLLATYRNVTIKDISYKLLFTIPGSKTEPVCGSSTIGFTLSSKREPLVIDFRVPEEYLKAVMVNGKTLEPEIINGHIIVPEKYLRRSYNEIKIDFRAGDMSLNRNDDFLYTLFVPDRASTAFPCFDQPDLKARFSLTLTIPSEYEAISNNPMVNIDTTGSSKTLRFAETKPLSTYLFAFAAGRFERIEREIDGVRMEMLHRESRPEYITNNSDEIFRLHYNSLKWLEDYTGIDYPFEKFGFVLIPSFQYSGMEHPGSICYRASSLLLEEKPTLNEKLSRASLIAHETSHIWFGDLVTMKWFDDVWLKEVFAGYMSDKIVNPDFPGVNHDLRFLLSRYPAAYRVDRTSGTNPVIQKLVNMKDAGSLYGGIIYNKAPIVMKHLEMITGSEGLRKGLQVYLSQYSFGNAEWDDLISILEKETSKPLEEWSTMWVKEPGMPFITSKTETLDSGFKTHFEEQDPDSIMRHWPQTLKTRIFTSTDTVNGECIPGDKKSSIITSSLPLCIIPDVSATAYGTFIFDTLTLSWIYANIDKTDDPLLRGVLWINLNENLINRTISPEKYYKTLLNAIEKEPDVQLLNYLIGRLNYVFWNCLSPVQRLYFSAETEALAWKKMDEADDAAQQRSWYGLYRNIALSDIALVRLEKIWEKGELPGGVKISEDEQSTLALNMALKNHPDADTILRLQLDRIKNPDRLQRFIFVMPSVSGEKAVRDNFFQSLKNPANREHEPWVIEALGYLDHPSVSDMSIAWIRPSLELLEEIKATGDIFFPGDWISTTLAGHNSEEAGKIVTMFLDQNPDYPPDLRLKILQAADHLLRQQAN